jgi:replication fork protection complex subunit Csm3/Swi3
MEGVEEVDNTTRVQLGSDVPVQRQTSVQPTAEEPDEDELDALLAESEQPAQPAAKALPLQSVPTDDDPFADEMEAMDGMEDMW